MKANTCVLATGMLLNFDANTWKTFGRGMQMRDRPHTDFECASICGDCFTENTCARSPHAGRLVQALVCTCRAECVQMWNLSLKACLKWLFWWKLNLSATWESRTETVASGLECNITHCLLALSPISHHLHSCFLVWLVTHTKSRNLCCGAEEFCSRLK